MLGSWQQYRDVLPLLFLFLIYSSDILIQVLSKPKSLFPSSKEVSQVADNIETAVTMEDILRCFRRPLDWEDDYDKIFPPHY